MSEQPFSVLGHDLFGEPVKPTVKAGPLAQRFTFPPLSVLNAREGVWQERKRAWLALGIKSEVGRGESILYGDSAGVTEPGLNAYRNAKKPDALLFKTASQARLDEIQGNKGRSGTSIFDPVLTELLYRWFSPHGGSILDPFAGGSVRGIVAGALGRAYTGIELRPEQVAANEVQADTITTAVRPRWVTGDSGMARVLAPGAYDMVMGCPPYGDLEVYSDLPGDLSAMTHECFLQAYRQIIDVAVGLLKPDRFACFTVGDFRDKKGHYRNFIGATVQAFLDAGCHYYNEAILVTAVGSLPIRVGKQFVAGRKLGRTHQNVLVFVKGDGKAAAAACRAADEAVVDDAELEADDTPVQVAVLEPVLPAAAAVEVADAAFAGAGGVVLPPPVAMHGAADGDAGEDFPAPEPPLFEEPPAVDVCEGCGAPAGPHEDGCPVAARAAVLKAQEIFNAPAPAETVLEDDPAAVAATRKQMSLF